jgi:hypothetical protein
LEFETTWVEVEIDHGRRVWIEKELERIRQDFNLTDEQFNRFREQRSLEAQITQERISEIHQLLQSDDMQERREAIAQIFAWMLDSVLRIFKRNGKAMSEALPDYPSSC